VALVRTQRLALAGVFSALAVLFLPASLPAQSVEAILARAEAHEKAGRWLEAAEDYGELARRQPMVPAWERRGRQCRTQEQIARQYQNPAFQNGLLQLPLEQALHLYGEVLSKIQAHYVEEVELDRLLVRGLERIDLALQNPDFLRAVFAVAPAEENLRRHRAALAQRWRELGVATRRDAQLKVQAIAISLQQELGASPTAVVIEFVNAAGEALDNYSAFLGPERFALEKSLASPNVAGIGLELQYGGGFLYVASLANTGPAARAGIQLHDRILRIDDVDVRRLGVEEASLRLLGRENTTVTLDVQGVLDLGPRVVEIPRERLSQPSLGTVRLVDPELGIGYVHLGLFQQTTLFELDNALDRLMMEGLRGLILDLRGNPGGSFESALQVADRFLLAGVITSTRGRGPGTTAIHRVQDDRALLIPLVLLIDGETASAAEILASALRDHRRARLVGQPTAGKGSIQMVFPLKTVPSGLRLTAARYWSPLEMAINDNPVQPDVLVDGSDALDGMEGMMSAMQLQQRQFEAALVEIRDLLLKAGMP